jgi:hypothetical protein
MRRNRPAGRWTPPRAAPKLRGMTETSNPAPAPLPTAATGATPPAAPAVPSAPPAEYGGPAGPEPTRYGDWEQKGRCTDF